MLSDGQEMIDLLFPRPDRHRLGVHEAGEIAGGLVDAQGQLQELVVQGVDQVIIQMGRMDNPFCQISESGLLDDPVKENPYMESLLAAELDVGLKVKVPDDITGAVNLFDIG